MKVPPKRTPKRLKQRLEVAAKLPPPAAEKLRGHLIAGWSVAYVRRRRTSVADAEAFRREKEVELRQLGGTEADLRAFSSACTAQIFAATERAAIGRLNVPARPVSNYNDVWLFELTEVRRR
jgi:hypothetical protein